MENHLTVNLSDFTPMELANIENAAKAKNMTVQEYIIFLLEGVATPNNG